jgi:elongator complex protein 3
MATSRFIILQKIITELIKKGDFRPSVLASLKRQTAAQERIKFPTNAELLSVYHKLIKSKSIAKNPALANLLQVCAIRTLSGVAVITVLTKPHVCPGQCLYCPSEPGMPKSYLKNEPAANRAFMTNFNPYAQVQVRLKALRDNGHPTDKIELIVLGGTWSAYPKNYRYWFIAECFRAANEKKSKIQDNINNLKNELKYEQKKNEFAKHRIIGLTLETRPDYINMAEIKMMRELGCTRVELGAQSVYDDILKINRRGHTVADTITATRLLKDAGFKINYHIMLNLLGSTPARDLKMFKIIFSDERFQPDLLKIYPCVVLKSAPLYKLWRAGKYKPYTQKQLVNLLIKIKKIIPPYVRIQRIIRDIPKQSIQAGCNVSNLRQIIADSGKKQCACIRCREVRNAYSPKDKIKLFWHDYPASGGREIFLSYESPDRKKLYALLRLRIPQINKPSMISGILPILQNVVLIRELHTYGKLVSLNADRLTSIAAQHTGLGKKLMAEAEKIARKESGYKKIAVISGVGVRDYYRQSGYCLQDEYMIKLL